jgi:hypothetical protein
VRGTTAIDHGAGPVPFFAGGDERFVDVSTDVPLPPNTSVEVCLPLPGVAPSAIRPARVLHGEGAGPATRQFVDRTSWIDPTMGTACARVASFSEFAVVTVDVCGGGQKPSDGILTVAGGLLGRRTIVVDGLRDCAQYPANLPRGLRQYCVPDADTTAGQCTVSVTLGINRGGCTRAPDGLDSHSALIVPGSYGGQITQGLNTTDLTGVFGPQIAALVNPHEATVGPVDLILATAPGRKITTHRLKQPLQGMRPGSGVQLDTDTDVLIIKCLDATLF